MMDFHYGLLRDFFHFRSYKTQKNINHTILIIVLRGYSSTPATSPIPKLLHTKPMRPLNRATFLDSERGNFKLFGLI